MRETKTIDMGDGVQVDLYTKINARFRLMVARVTQSEQEGHASKFDILEKGIGLLVKEVRKDNVALDDGWNWLLDNLPDIDKLIEAYTEVITRENPNALGQSTNTPAAVTPAAVTPAAVATVEKPSTQASKSNTAKPSA